MLGAMVVIGILLSPCSGLAAEPESATPTEKADAWVSLVQGDSLAGWCVLIAGQEKNVDPNHIFSVKDGVVHAFKDAPNGAKMPFGGILTEKEYSRFHLRLEFKWGVKKFAPRQNVPRDAGILFHATPPDRIWPQSVECQIQEGDVGDIYAVYSTVTTTIDPKTKGDIDPVSKLNSPVFMEASEGGVPVTQTAQGSPWDVGRVRRSHDWEHEGWNTVDVIADGDRAVYLVNGKINNRCTNICRPDPKNPQRTIPLTHGKILLQAEGAEVLYRNIKIRNLSDSDKSLLNSKR
jgi:hypothetical protein